MGSLLMPLLGSVAAKAGDALVGELLLAWGLDKSRRKLERHLAAVQCILLEAEAKSRNNPAVRRWIKDLKTAAYQADDVLDDFRYEALRRRAAKIRCCATARKVLKYFTADSPVVFRLHMSWKLKDALETIDELVVEMNNFHFLQLVEAPTVDHPQTHSRVNESEIVGRQDDKEQLVKILLDHNNRKNNNVVVLPIVGMGGIGKTTLAQLVHNDQRVKHHFDLVLWACVSDKFIIEEIIRSVIEVATMKKCDLTQMETLQKELCGVLGKKRYLLVLDNVWNEDGPKWDEMISLLCSNSGSGSAIIVTSRSDKVASIMGTIPPHQMSLLNEDQSWELFHKNTFGRQADMEEQLISMAKGIVHKCKGLPLAIKTVAALLCSKYHIEWFSVLDSAVWKDEILRTTGIVPALQLSYDHLSSEEKICFAFCAIFPKDSPMDKDTLIQLWMANDFIASETRGQQIFNVLVWRCFLQDVENQKDMHFGGPGEYYIYNDLFNRRPTICKMHDLMHDLAEFVSGNDCSILEKSLSCHEFLKGSRYASSLQHEVQHLSLDYVSNNTTAALKEILSPQARTIFVTGKLEWTMGQRDMGKTLSMAMSKFTSLRALKTISLETTMTSLKHLRYLDCSHSNILALPESTAMLYSLQTLKLIGCGQLKVLPEVMRYMSSLRHIFLVGCYSLERMPRSIGKLNSLQTLTSFVIDSGAGHGIDQLKDLNICGALSLTGLRKVQSTKNAKESNISSKHNLKRLLLDWYGPYSTDVGYKVDTNAEGILEALHPHKWLEVLLLSNYTGAKFSPWMHNSTLLEHLSELRLYRCKNCKDLPPLWQLPALGYLDLDSLDSLTSICIGNDDTNNMESCISPPPFFPKLETLILTKMPKLERWQQEVAGQVGVVSFPQLKKLAIFECPMLTSMPKMLPLLENLRVVGEIPFPNYHMMNLSMLYNLECKGEIVVEPMVGRMRTRLELLKPGDSNVRLRLQGLTANVQLERLEEELNRIPCRFIKELHIENCGFLVSSEPPQIQRNIWNHFGFVERMYISGMNNVVQWPAVELSNLTDSLPQLQHLVIFDCHNLVEIPKLPASLEKLYVANCPKLVSLPTNLGNIKQLREVDVYGCDALMTFPDGMYGATALKQLRMTNCRRLERLPVGLLQHLPALEQLHISRCPNLEEVFSRAGPYWNLVQAIPDKSVCEIPAYIYGRN